MGWLCVVGIGIRSSGAADVDVKLVYPASLSVGAPLR
jgi:hypothetical protein